MSDTTITPMSAEGIKQLRDLLVYRKGVCGPGLAYFSPERALALIAAYDSAEARAEKAEAENARLRERLESALDKIADIQENGEEEGVCHACGICAGCPEDWQPTDDHNCRVMLELWADGEPLPWEAARRAVDDAGSEVKG